MGLLLSTALALRPPRAASTAAAARAAALARTEAEAAAASSYTPPSAQLTSTPVRPSTAPLPWLARVGHSRPHTGRGRAAWAAAYTAATLLAAALVGGMVMVMGLAAAPLTARVLPSAPATLTSRLRVSAPPWAPATRSEALLCTSPGAAARAAARLG